MTGITLWWNCKIIIDGLGSLIHHSRTPHRGPNGSPRHGREATTVTEILASAIRFSGRVATVAPDSRRYRLWWDIIGMSQSERQQRSHRDTQRRGQ